MKGKIRVGIAGKSGPFENIKNALSQIDISKVKGKSVLIKPNIGREALPEHGYNTHPQAVAAVIEALQEAGAAKIAIGESPLVGINTFEAFKKAGITEIADKYEIELIDFDERKPVTANIPIPRVLKNTRIAAEVLEYDILVSVPVAKTHMHTQVTLGMKNLKGCLYRHEKVRYHQLEYIGHQFSEKTLDSAISDLSTILLPDITVVDGYIGMEGLGPSGGTPIKSDFAVASAHPIAADLFACVLMGINPEDVVHLKLVAKRNSFSMNLDHYLPPDNYTDFITSFELPPKTIALHFDDTIIYECEACSSCLSTLMLFLRRFRGDMNDFKLDDGKFHIAIGKGNKNVKDGTILVGNCTRNLNDKGIFVKGCPPVPTRIYEAITGTEPEENEPEVE
ncbi:MAG: DUF362 domain-containing protein [Bacteroidales bacterium]|nr:DUF362 domain-containing protein [Bacteroidales bacterium]MBN2819160.1 DUF362 domain-containing protein [Bacteroidales bacterium]